MSVDNSELLMLLGGKKSKSTIGKAGQQGFGVGVYGGSPSDLKAMGLTPMEGCEDPTSDNYGNYIHTNGSVMVFIPAFAIRIGNASAPLYSKYGADTIEIGDVGLNGKDGWAIPRGFYDGGKLHSGFFIDKYLCSKDLTGKLAVSVKLGEPILLSLANNVGSTGMPDCGGGATDAIILGRARGEHYALVSCYQWAIISLISLTHAQAATSVASCAWYDAAGLTNYPKGNNANTTDPKKDVDDKSIYFSVSVYSKFASTTGSATPLVKTTHNGQYSGITDVNGNMWQPVLGVSNSTANIFKAAKLSVKMHDFTMSNHDSDSLFDSYTVAIFNQNQWNHWKSPALFTPDDPEFPLCGVVPKSSMLSSNGTERFGTDGIYIESITDSMMLVAGSYRTGTNAGVWCRDCGDYWRNRNDAYSFRVAAYPP